MHGQISTWLGSYWPEENTPGDVADAVPTCIRCGLELLVCEYVTLRDEPVCGPCARADLTEGDAGQAAWHPSAQ